MSIFLKLNLISHVIFGLLGVALFLAVLINGVKVIDSKRAKFLQRASFWGFASFILSWLTGGYYYVVHYGTKVKPIIKAGDYPWAHSIMMETKEHIFLFLPFVAAVVALFFYLFGESAENFPKIKKAVIWLLAIIVFIGIASALMGEIISEAAK